MINHYGLGLPLKGGRTLGFQSESLKVIADFVTGTYNDKGTASTFNNLFNFTRASNAWLFNNEVLNTYSTNIPRFKDGLVIEKESVNKVKNSRGTGWVNTYEVDGTTTYVNPYGGGNTSRLITTDVEFKTLRLPSIAYIANTFMTLTLVAKSDTALELVSSSEIGIGVLSLGMINNTPINYPVEVLNHTHKQLVDGWVEVTISFLTKATGTSFGFQFIQREIGKGFSVAFAQVENGVGTSPIISEATAVTRRADILSTKNVITAIDGDWDSTLNLSISDGLLVHTGYGVIRTLEIT